MGIGLGLAAGPLNLGLVLIRVGKTESNWGWIPDWWIASTNSPHAWGLLMEPVVAAANSETSYGLSGVRLPPAIPIRVDLIL